MKATAEAIRERSASTVNFDMIKVGCGDSVLLLRRWFDSSRVCRLLLKVEIFDRYLWEMFGCTKQSNVRSSIRASRFKILQMCSTYVTEDIVRSLT